MHCNKCVDNWSYGVKNEGELTKLQKRLFILLFIQKFDVFNWLFVFKQ